MSETEEPWAARFGLVRPRHGRYLAGVCAAIARATNTDPLLWRVLIGVLALFGVGIVIYLASWLIMPAEGDTASPIEALFGRGTSSTSALLTLVLSVITVVLLGAITDSSIVAIIAAVALVVAALAINPKISARRPMEARPEPAPTQTAEQAAAPAYQPPFAPHGPYALPPLEVPTLKKPKLEPSRLGRLIFAVMLLTLGVLGLADMAGASIGAEIYVAAALAVVGLGLIVGAWFGRARGYILLGLLLSLLLPVVQAGDPLERAGTGRVHWNPPSIDLVSEEYSHRFGEAVLDLSDVDFNGQDRTVEVDISFGDLRVYVPPNVDTTVISNVSFGDAKVFGRSTSGVGVEHAQFDEGFDGAGGGRLTIVLNVSFGHAEVDR